jgi:hypothetical protein
MEQVFQQLTCLLKGISVMKAKLFGKQGKQVIKPSTLSNGKSGVKAGSKTVGIKILTHNRYPLVPIEAIEIVDRPPEGEEHTKLFFNARSPIPLDHPEMRKLRHDLRIEEMHTPLLVDAITAESSTEVIERIELVAGERRKRNCAYIWEQDLPCGSDEADKKYKAEPWDFKPGEWVIHTNRFGKVVQKKDDETYVISFGEDPDDVNVEVEREECLVCDLRPTVSGRKHYSFLPCRIYYNLSDERKLRLNYNENNQHDPLPVKDEVALIERLVKRGLTLKQIATLLNTNITLVSQVKSFRTALPPEAFKKLMAGDMVKNVAVKLLSFDGEKRALLFEESEKEGKKEYKAKKAKHTNELEQAEDEADLHEHEAKKAEQKGDSEKAAKEKKKAATAVAKAKKAKERLERIEAEKDHVKQGHVDKAAAKLGLTPRKAKMLSKEQIEERWVKGLVKYVTGGKTDPICGDEIPADYAAILRRGAQAILNGVYDPLSVIRDFMVENDKWTLPEEITASKSGMATTAPKKKGSSLPSKVLRDDEADEEDFAALENEELDDDELDPRFEDDDDDDIENFDECDYSDDEDEDDILDDDFHGFDPDSFDSEWN